MSGITTNGSNQSSQLEDIRLSYISDDSGQQPKTAAPKSNGFIRGFMAFFSFAPKEESQQRTAQKRSWGKAISDFFSGLFGDQSREPAGSSLKGATANWGEAAASSIKDTSQRLQSTVVQGSAQSLYEELAAVETNDETAITANRDNQRTGGVFGFLQRSILGQGKGQSQDQQNVSRDSMLPRNSSESGSFLGASYIESGQPKPGVRHTMADDGQVLDERGEKLERVGQGAENLRAGAANYGRLASQLREQQQAQAEATHAALNRVTFGLYGWVTGKGKSSK